MADSDHLTRRTLMKTAVRGTMLSFASAGMAMAQTPVGGMGQSNVRDIQRRRDCEEGRPTCLPSIRQQLERERVNQLWMGSMIAGVLALVILLIVRANRKKTEQDRKETLERQMRMKQRRKEIRASANSRHNDDLPPSLDDPLD